MRDGLLEELVGAIKVLREAVVEQTEVIKKQTSVQAAEKRHRLTVDVQDDDTRSDLERIFDLLFYVDPNGEVTRGDILKHLRDCKNPEVRDLIESYNLTTPQSKGYRAFIEIARGKAKRQFYRDGSQYMSGIASRSSKVNLSALNDDFSL